MSEEINSDPNGQPVNTNARSVSVAKKRKHRSESASRRPSTSNKPRVEKDPEIKSPRRKRVEQTYHQTPADQSQPEGESEMKEPLTRPVEQPSVLEQEVPQTETITQPLTDNPVPDPQPDGLISPIEPITPNQPDPSLLHQVGPPPISPLDDPSPCIHCWSIFDVSTFLTNSFQDLSPTVQCAITQLQQEKIDGTEFLYIDEETLKRFSITLGVRKKIINFRNDYIASNPPSPFALPTQPIRDWSVSDLCQYLSGYGLEAFSSIFQEHEMDGLEVHLCDPVDLMALINTTSYPHGSITKLVRFCSLIQATPLSCGPPPPTDCSFFNTPVQEWSILDVSKCLELAGLGQYKEAFTVEDIDGETLLNLSENEIKDDLGMKPLGHRKKLLRLRSKVWK